MPPFPDAYRTLEPPHVAAPRLPDAILDDLDTIAVDVAILTEVLARIRTRRAGQPAFGLQGDRVNHPDLCGNWNRLPEDLEDLIAGVSRDDADALRLRGPTTCGV